MIYVEYINGDKDSFESKGRKAVPWTYNKDQACYIIETLNGTMLIPRESIKFLFHMKTK